MAMTIGHEAAIPNPALQPFRVLIGEWRTEGAHPYFPGKVFHGRASFDWVEGGAFLVMRTEIDEPEIPSGIALFGTDDEAKRCIMLYFDERGVSRHYQVAVEGDKVRWWRDHPGFSQEFTLKVVEAGTRMAGQGRMDRGSGWEPDLALTYIRVR